MVNCWPKSVASMKNALLRIKNFSSLFPEKKMFDIASTTEILSRIHSWMPKENALFQSRVSRKKQALETKLFTISRIDEDDIQAKERADDQDIWQQAILDKEERNFSLNRITNLFT
jgi:hypothetical protein